MDKIQLVFVSATLLLIAIPTIGLIRHNSIQSNLTLNPSSHPTQPPELEPTATPSTEPTPTLTPHPTPTATTLHQTNSPTPTTTNANSDWRYPNSTVITQSDNNLTLSSSADPTTITDWYKQKIQSSGMNTKTFVTTNSNDNVLNKLAGANNDQSVNIEIKRDSGQTNTTIVVSQ